MSIGGQSQEEVLKILEDYEEVVVLKRANRYA